MNEDPREEELFSQYLISLNKADKLKDIMREIHNMENNRDPTSVPVRSFREGLIPEPSFFPPNLTGGKYAKLPNVSKKLEFIDNNNGSKIFVAKKKINIGDVLMVEKGAIIANHPVEEFAVPTVYRCHRCLRIVDYFVTCPECDVVVFCGYKCRYYSWNEYHRWECYGMQRGYFSNNSISYITMRMLFFDLQFEENALSKEYYETEYNYDHFKNLPYNLPEKNNIELFSVLKECVEVVLYLAEHTDFFEWVVEFPNYKNKSQFKLYSIIGGMLVRYYFQFRQNYITLKEACLHGFPNSKQVEYIADGLFLSTQWFSNNAHPNTVWFHYERYLIVKACQEISAGDKITVQWKENVNDCSCEECMIKAKYNSFLCKKCKSAVWPVEKKNSNFYLSIKYIKSMDEVDKDIDFVCENCNRPCNLDEYKSKITYAQHNIDIYHKRHTTDYLKYAVDECKKILDRNHIYFVLIHALYIQYYLNSTTTTTEVTKVIEKASESIRVIKLHYGKASKVSVNAQIYILYQITECCKRKNTFNKAIIQYCQSLLEDMKPVARFYYLLQVVEPVARVITLEAQLLNSKNP